MAHPKRRRGVQACIVVKDDETILSANKAAFRELADWMTWIADSKASEHYECHVVWHLWRMSAKKPNVFVRFDQSAKSSVGRKNANRRNHEAFELTFVQVEEADLARLRRRGYRTPTTEEEL